MLANSYQFNSYVFIQRDEYTFPGRLIQEYSILRLKQPRTRKSLTADQQVSDGQDQEQEQRAGAACLQQCGWISSHEHRIGSETPSGDHTCSSWGPEMEETQQGEMAAVAASSWQGEGRPEGGMRDPRKDEAGLLEQ